MEYKLRESKAHEVVNNRNSGSLGRQQARSGPFYKLQKTIGNRAMQRYVQAKLKVSEEADIFEQEADRVAKQVMTMSNPNRQHSAQWQEILSDNRNANSEQMGTRMEPSVSRMTDSKGAGEVEKDIENQLEQSAGNGSYLPDQVRRHMEPRFGADFSGVRVHTGDEAIQMNKALNAQAFTIGKDIYYGANSSPTDMELAAHELTHVLQQGEIDQHSNNNHSGANTNADHQNLVLNKSSMSAVTPNLSRRMIQRRGRPIPGGALPIPAASNSVDGSRVVSKLNEMAGGMRRGFEGFEGTTVERQIVNALESANLQPRSIAINFLDDRGLNILWTGTVNIRMENATRIEEDQGGSGVGTIRSGGGGTGTSGTTGSESSTSDAGLSGEFSQGGHEGAPGGKVGATASTSTTTTRGESQGASGASTTGGETRDRLQRYMCTIVADIFLRCEADFSGSDYVNPFKWGFAGTAALMGPFQRRGSVDCGQWTYQISEGFAPPTPPT